MLHGLDEHSLRSDSHRKPVNPVVQLHTKRFAELLCEQVPPLLHGAEAHSLTSDSQRGPEKPAGQVHEYKLEGFIPSTHTAPLAQGLEAHSSTSRMWMVTLAKMLNAIG